ncbi:hypothetical protein [Paraliomyxa miuraensis]|uniref:hypothetical protein n=1 Tax=Paraliomyxa miuraensis TaxID=376150 RepID=UPI00224D622B|nr:hypothetical protein [Paraliomyxa miuraensis]
MLDDVVEHGVLAERCGSTDPVRLMPLAPNESIGLAFWYYPNDTPTSFDMAPSGDGWVLLIHTYDQDLTPTTPYHFEYGDENAPQRVSSRIVRVDGCGGDARVVVENSHRFRAPSGNEPWIACNTRDVFTFDPEEEHSGQWHMDLTCPWSTVGDAFVSKVGTASNESHTLVRARLPLDGPADITPLATVHPIWPVVRVGSSDQYMALTEMYELIEIDAWSGQVTMLRPEAGHSFGVSNDGRFVVYEAGATSPRVRLWDRWTDEEQYPTPSGWEDEPHDAHLAGNVVSVENFEREVTRLVLLPSGADLLLDGSWQGVAQLGDTYVLKHTSDDRVESLAILEPGSDTPRPIPHGTLREHWVHDERLWVLGVVDDADPSRLGLLELAGPDFTPRVVATGIWYPKRLADGRLLTVIDRNSEDRYGTLVLVDADGGMVDIDHDVLVTNVDMAPLPNDVVVYAVRDADNERTGVWAAQIAPIAEP